MGKYQAEYDIVYGKHDETFQCNLRGVTGCKEPVVMCEDYEDSMCEFHTEEAYDQDAADRAVKAWKEE